MKTEKERKNTHLLTYWLFSVCLSVYLFIIVCQSSIYLFIYNCLSVFYLSIYLWLSVSLLSVYSFITVCQSAYLPVYYYVSLSTNNYLEGDIFCEAWSYSCGCCLTHFGSIYLKQKQNISTQKMLIQ